MNGAPGTTGGGIADTLEKNWLPITVGAGGAALLGFGRAGSPASNLGRSVVGPILGYYVNQAATADERMRRQKIEDEFLQQKRDEISRTEQYRPLEVASRLGYTLGPQGTPGGVTGTVGGQSFTLVPPKEFSPDALSGVIGSAIGPEAAQEFTQATKGMSPQQALAYWQPWLQAKEVQRGRERTEKMRGAVDALGRPTGEEYAGGVHTLQPPMLSARELPFIRENIEDPHVKQGLMDRLAAYDPRFGGAFATPQAGPGEQMTRTFTREFGKPLRQTTQFSPVSFAERESADTVKINKDFATRMSVSPLYTKVKASLEPAAQFVLQNAVDHAIATGSPDSLTTANDILLVSTQPEKLGLKDLEAAYLKNHPKALGDYMRTRTEGKDKETFYLKQIANVGQRKQYLQHTYDAQGKVTLNPALAGMEQEEATYWRRLAEADPQHYFEEAFTHLPRLLRWDRAMFNKEVKDFATRYRIPLANAETP